MQIRLAGITKESCVDGPGLRFVVFVQGCRQACPDCHNPDTWDETGGRLVEVAEIVAQIREKADLIDGITLSGGEPFLQTPACLELVRSVQEQIPQLSVLVYSGYTFEELLKDPLSCELLTIADMLVDGPFFLEKRAELPFRGSSNQRVLDPRKSIVAGKAMEI